ncbi:ABC transporter ATP-binding protein [Acidaminobacter sp. JC074]|uniref:ABC transporter ATP-binding protein n=1 Tax=Acidaminobacter sp. JC074 TaxID=2530199 RepID=UPI001F0F75F8|nr:ABC transporter ATP-binding protein [Acidaminobacter sp. JC074]MCH4887486.1 ABC transporter ATP-binding protein [Acidaminobacter sp. JC074]
MTENKRVIEAINLRKEFNVKVRTDGKVKERKTLKAVDGINIFVNKGETLGIVGESGCGKTTTAKLLLGLHEPTDGSIVIGDTKLTHMNRKDMKAFRRQAQMVFQDPYESLNPRFRIKDTIMEPLEIHKIGKDKAERYEMAKQILEESGLKPAEQFMERFPHEMSGGQRQRVAIARALVLQPDFLIADEPVSMLDVSIRAGVLKLLRKMITTRDLAGIVISHDISLVRYISDRTAVMYLGKVVEQGPTESLIEKRYHPYTDALMEAAPNPDPELKFSLSKIKGEAPNPVDLPCGCRFHTRCPKAMDVCKKDEPIEVDMGGGHMVACHLYGGK